MSVQQTLAMNEADPLELSGALSLDTFMSCPVCDEVMLVSRRHDHRHDTMEYVHLGDPKSQNDGEDKKVYSTSVEYTNDGGPEILGSWYDIELSYSVRYNFRVPAHSGSQAKELAKDWKFDAHPSDSEHVHTRRTERSAITTDDVPDDYDPYGSELLHEAIERMGEDD